MARPTGFTTEETETPLSTDILRRLHATVLARSEKVYMCAVKDLWSGRIAGHSIGWSAASGLSANALLTARPAGAINWHNRSLAITDPKSRTMTFTAV